MLFRSRHSRIVWLSCWSRKKGPEYMRISRSFVSSSLTVLSSGGGIHCQCDVSGHFQCGADDHFQCDVLSRRRRIALVASSYTPMSTSVSKNGRAIGAVEIDLSKNLPRSPSPTSHSPKELGHLPARSRKERNHSLDSLIKEVHL